MNTILIGIAGGTGSGKTTLADKLIDSFGDDEVSILRHDNYYKRHDDMCYEESARNTPGPEDRGDGKTPRANTLCSGGTPEYPSPLRAVPWVY